MVRSQQRVGVARAAALLDSSQEMSEVRASCLPHQYAGEAGEPGPLAAFYGSGGGSQSAESHYRNAHLKTKEPVLRREEQKEKDRFYQSILAASSGGGEGRRGEGAV